MHRPDMDPSLVRSLSLAIRGRVVSEPSAIAPFGHDASPLAGAPGAVVAPADAEDVVALVRWARRNRIPLVGRGGGTSLDGESVPPDGAVVVDFSEWKGVIEVDPCELWARVRPGTVNRELQQVLRSQGVFFPPNPGSWMTATIGGNVATNASGPRSFRYGPTRMWVRAVDAVLGTGEAVHLGARVAKRSVGPDLVSFFVGSEGTLGLMTEVTVRLAPLPARREGLIVPLPGSISLAAVARRLRTMGEEGLSAVEYIDRASAGVLADRRGLDWPHEADLLLLEIEAPDDRSVATRRESVGAALRSVGVEPSPIVFSDSDELWTLRGASGQALDERLGPRVREDVAVPLGRIDDLLREVREIARSADVPVFLYGHLGEGSFHPNYAVDPASPAATRVRTALLNAALALGGTVSSEHGIGQVKSAFLARELGPVSLEILDTVKRRCDPEGILNPGKLYPPRPVRAGGRPSPSLSGSEAPGAPAP